MESGHAQGELLASLLPSGTTPVALFTATLRTELTLLFATIVPGGTTPCTMTIYHDVDGTTYANTELVSQETRIALTQSPLVFQARHPGSGIFLAPGDSIGVQCSVANNMNFMLYGITEHIAEFTRE